MLEKKNALYHGYLQLPVCAKDVFADHVDDGLDVVRDASYKRIAFDNKPNKHTHMQYTNI